MAKDDRQAISDRTRRALQAIKDLERDPERRRARRAAGKKPLGNPNGASALRRAGEGNVAAVAAIKAATDKRARDDMLAVIEDVRAAGAVTLLAIAAELNIREIPTARGGRWHATSVKRLLARGVTSTSLALGRGYCLSLKFERSSWPALSRRDPSRRWCSLDEPLDLSKD